MKTLEANSIRIGNSVGETVGIDVLLQNLHERIRDVRQGPDGALWLLTDSSNGRVLRVAPAAK
jgi:glucose/arabinose dehydrogenase